MSEERNFTFGENVKKYRLEKGWDQKTLAEKMGYKSAASVNKIEKGTKTPTMRIVDKYAEVLGVDSATLLGLIPVKIGNDGIERLIDEDDIMTITDSYDTIYETQGVDDDMEGDPYSDFFWLMDSLTPEHKLAVFSLIAKYHREDTMKNKIESMATNK